MPQPLPAPASDRLQSISRHIMASTPVAKPPITCHVLDTSVGRPASSIPVTLHRLSSSDASATAEWTTTGLTNSDGRIAEWNDKFETQDGEVYKLRFDTWEYFRGETFFPCVEVQFVVKKKAGNEHYHVPVLLSPYSYSTYRGS